MRRFLGTSKLFSRNTTALLIAAVLLCARAYAAEPVAAVAASTGDVRVQRSGTAGYQTVNVNAELFAGDTLNTGPDGRATLLLSDESLVQINNNTRLVLKSVDQSAGWLPAAIRNAAGSIYELLQGEIWFRNKNPETDLEIKTPHVAIGVRGTEFVVRTVPNTITEVDMLEGRIEAFNNLGSVEAISGEQVYAVPGAAPAKRLLLKPEDAVQWTVVVPPLLSPEAAGLNDPSGKRYRQAGELLATLEKNGSTAAREVVEIALNEQPGDPFLLTTKAWLDLNAGHAQAAVTELASITANHPDEAFAWQVYALALLTTNQADAALNAVTTAQRLAPGSANAYLVESYIHQAQFDLQAAQIALDKALLIDPANTLALVNVGQLRFAQGNIKDAREYANRALAADNTNPDALNLIGFLDLAESQTSSAIERFDAALKLDPAFAEAYLGLGLAEVRQGNETAALEAITTAVALDPTRSTYMSYWGRVLYELKRHQRALEVLERAAQLDPLDPTPWYLQAVVLRDLNMHGEAIEHYNKAVELNDNRAVYRSRFLLDQDLAVRNVDLSIIFQEYRFNAWADRKAVSAVNQNYGDYSAHIMAAGALSGQENRDTAFLSETLQARILQPANINSFNTFNQYTSFLDQPKFETNALVRNGSFDIRDIELEAYGALPDQNLAVLAAYVDTQSDGWNGSNGDELRDLSTIVKWDAGINDRFMFAFSDFKLTLFDDLNRRFEYDDVSRPDYETETNLQRFELGYTHSFRPGTDLMAYLAYIDLETENKYSVLHNDASITIPDVGTLIVVEEGSQRQSNDRPSMQAQLVVNARIDQHEVVFGTSNYWGDNDVQRREDNVAFGYIEGSPIPPLPNPQPEDEVRIDNNNDRAFHSFFLQDTWSATSWLDVEAALYYDYLKNSEPLVDDDWTERELNPRVGAVIRATENDTFRVAAFRYRAPFFSAQLSPTEIAGLTIYRNSQEGAQTKEADIAYERDWGSGFFSSQAYMTRTEVEGRLVPNLEDLQGPGKFDPPVPFTGSGRTHGIELELNQQLGNRVGVVSRYLLADIDNEWQPDTDRYEKRLEAGLTFIHPIGVSTGIRHGYRYLNMDNRTSNESMDYTDVDFSYLFPNRKIRITAVGRNIADNNFNWVTDRFTLGGVIPERNWLLSMEVSF